jgi:hypothetical protein
VKLTLGDSKMTAGQYRQILTVQLQSLAGMSDADEIELEIEQ